jgi:hypothetical protein
MPGAFGSAGACRELGHHDGLLVVGAAIGVGLSLLRVVSRREGATIKEMPARHTPQVGVSVCVAKNDVKFVLTSSSA